MEEAKISSELEYFTPKTLEEACSLAIKYQEQARIIAGGTDLLIQSYEIDKT